MWGFFLTLLSGLRMNPISYAANLIGVTEPALKLLVSLMMAYPIAVMYHKKIRGQYRQYREYYFIVMGLDMALYNFGISTYHNAIPALVIYATTKILGPGKWNAIFTFIFNITYLLVAYVMTESEEYDITWTMPHCVLTLKLIALAFDLWDADKIKRGKVVSASNRASAVSEAPTLVELFGFLYFPSCFLVGPIFSFKRYKDFVNEVYPLNSGAKHYESQALRKLLEGVGYMMAFQIGGSVFSMKYMQSDSFWENGIIYRHLYCGMWAHIALYKYIACWLITEASCIRFGMSYNGKGKNDVGADVSLWNGCNNIKLMQFEGATRFQHYIDSFNCNTNRFASEYVYKRLKFLNNKNLSQLLTLTFLALWHGICSGYYVTFFNEFIIMVMEKQLEPIIIKTRIYHTAWNNSTMKVVLYVILKLYTIVFMGWSLVPFDLKTFGKWWNVYSSLWFSGFVLFVPWSFVYKPLLLYIIRKYKLE